MPGMFGWAGRSDGVFDELLSRYQETWGVVESMRVGGAGLGGHAFQDQQLRAGRLQRAGIAQEGLGGLVLAGLDPVTAQAVDMLRRQAQVGADGHALAGQFGHPVGDLAAAFQLDHGRARLQQPARGFHAGGPVMVGQERHVGDQQRMLQAAGHGPGVIGHVVDGHRHGAVVALDHVAQGVAHQHAVEAGGVQAAGEGRVVAGQHGHGPAGGLALGQRGHADGTPPGTHVASP